VIPDIAGLAEATAQKRDRQLLDQATALGQGDMLKRGTLENTANLTDEAHISSITS
jgi:hypothetical protein